MLKYEITIEWSDEDQLYIAEAPELFSCMAHGDTYEEALKSIQEAMELWLDVARGRGDPIPEPKGWSLPGSDPIEQDEYPSPETLRMQFEEKTRQKKGRRAS